MTNDRDLRSSAKPTISIVTATLNVADSVQRLIKSLESQTDQDFSWVVVDGASTDGTLDIVRRASGRLHIELISSPDCGIYDALNRAVRSLKSDYYLVLGADDSLEPRAVEKYREAAAESGADFITALITVGGVLKPRHQKHEWLYGQFAHVSSHAVGLLVRRDLHDSHGMYSRQLRVAADQLFILTSIHMGATVFKADFVAGDFSTTGESGRDLSATLTEGFRAQLLAGHNPAIQIILLALRLLRHRSRL